MNQNRISRRRRDHSTVALAFVALLAFDSAIAETRPAAPTSAANPPIRFHVATERSALVEKMVAILKQRIRERCDLVAEESETNATLVLAQRPGIGEEGYCIEKGPGGAIRIVGNDDRGLLYGVGHFLRTSRFSEGQFTASPWRGTSVPECHVRGMYWAFHNNFYVNAPLPELHRYLEDHALWGMNAILFHFSPKSTDNAGLASPDEAARYRDILRAAKGLGLRVGLLAEPNMGRNDAPDAIRAPRFPDTKPPRRGYHGVRICPSNPAGFAYLSTMLGQYLDGYEDIGLDYAVAFPYDSGGCGCKDCWPWGARGYVTISREFSRLARERYPQVKVVLGTWCFDVRAESDGEYEGLSRVLAQDTTWVDAIMDDSHGDYPRYFLDHGVAGSLPLLNFAEISMWGRYPWGGTGANPLPARFQRIWDQSGRALDGGFPYSEGKYDDINKFIFTRFFWKRGTKAEDAVREYVAAEYSPDVVEPVSEAIRLLERNHERFGQNREEIVRAHDLLHDADAAMSPRVRESWRWRILMARAIIDFERVNHDGQVTDRCDAAYEELIRISHLQTAWGAVTPPSRSRLSMKRGKEAAPPPPPGSQSE